MRVGRVFDLRWARALLLVATPCACSTAYSVAAGNDGGASDAGDAGSIATASDGSTDGTGVVVDAAVVDAGEASTPTTCDVTTPFDTITRISELDDLGENQHLRLSSDFLIGYFSSTRPSQAGALQLYTATRPSLTAPFANVTPMTTLSAGNADDARSTVTGDGLTIYFYSARGPTTIYFATRATTKDPFGLASPVVNAVAGYDAPFVREDGNELYYTMADNIYAGTLSAPGTLGTSTQVNVATGSTNSATAPTVTPDDLVLYFASSAKGAGLNDIYVTARPTVNDAWVTPTVVGELATAADEKPSFITRDRCALYFYRDESEAGTETGYEIYVATRRPK
jgi:hypothetical protein